MNESELLRLRGEVGRLRHQSAELDSLRKENAGLRQLAESEPATDPKTNRLPVVANVLLSRIGRKAISEAQIRTSIAVQVGDIFDQAVVDQDVRNLNDTGWFYRLRVIQNTNDSGVVLNFCLQERPKLTTIRFEGNTRYDEAYLAKALSSKVGALWDERVLFSDVQGLQEFYRQLGFSRTQVTLASKINEDVGEAEAIFKISE